jgi:hypothetical protein
MKKGVGGIGEFMSDIKYILKLKMILVFFFFF